MMTDRDLFRAVDEVLHYLWDPCGAAGSPTARDEYYRYVEPVYAALQANGDELAIANLLQSIATERMGLGENHAHHLKTAGALIEWKAFHAAWPPKQSFELPGMPS